MTHVDTPSLLRDKHLKSTRIRNQCIDLLSRATGPLDAIELTKKIQANKTTIYRELATLIKSDIIIEIDFGDGKKRYELASRDHHHHLICSSCKSVSEYKVHTDLSNEEKSIQKTHGFIVKKHSLEFFGTCKQCI
jgi:Fe2+ or Zn2+ uptake regulation protein